MTKSFTCVLAASLSALVSVSAWATSAQAADGTSCVAAIAQETDSFWKKVERERLSEVPFPVVEANVLELLQGSSPISSVLAPETLESARDALLSFGRMHEKANDIVASFCTTH